MTSSYKFKEEIVISGISGVYPLSEDILEFKENLLSKKNLVEDHESELSGAMKTTKTYGALKDLNGFDPSFFFISGAQAEGMDLDSRIIMEKTFEAIVDAGYSPNEFKGTNTGVFIGSYSSTPLYLTEVTLYSYIGKLRTMLANRISYWLDVTGPSYVTDTACSSSVIALENAYRAIQDGVCDTAIVGGANLCTTYFYLATHNLKELISATGSCKSFDEDADGFVRAEAIVVIILQKKKNARRIYANLLHAKTNCNGFSKLGISCPSEKGHFQLYNEFYREINIDPLSVEYIEAHGTGTKIGDKIEVEAIEKFFCNGRKNPLKIGSVKSNMGHSEATAGLCSISKVIIAYESKLIPPNINLNKLNSNIPALHNGNIEVVTEAIPCDKELMAVNGFGVGGANGHILLSPNIKEKKPTNKCCNDLPRLVTVSGRTPEAIDTLFNQLEKYHQDYEYQALYHKIFTHNINGHLERGYILLNTGKENIKYRSEFSGENRPIWFVFSGMGSQWPSMGKSLMKIAVISESIRRSHEILKTKHIDLIKIITDDDSKMFDNILNCFVGIAAIQIALVDFLRTIGITPDGIIGHSVGEIGCAYADGCMTAEQMILVAYYRGLTSIETKFVHGTMVAIGEGYEKMKDLLPQNIEIACHNGPNSCTISGSTVDVEAYLQTLEEKKIFNRVVESGNIAFHSSCIAHAGPKFLTYLENVLPEKKLRSSKWICTSAPESEWETDSVKFSSPEYHMRNLLSSVLFEEGSKHIPSNAILVEIAPHGLLQAILKRSLPSTISNIPLTMKNHQDGTEFLLNALGKLYVAGVNFNIDKLYPTIEFPVSRGTPMISPYIKWQRNEKFTDTTAGAMKKSGERNLTISATNPDFQFLTGHVIDERNLFPATGYLVLIWETIANINNKNYLNTSVIFEDVRFERATVIPKKGSVSFYINIQRGTGYFEILNNQSVVVTGRVHIPNNPNEELEPYTPFEDELEPGVLPLSTKDVYKELRLKGYHYTGQFKKITYANPNGKYGRVLWESNYTTFMDTMAHILLLKEDLRELLVPTAIRKISIDVRKHAEILKTLDENNQELPVYFYENQNLLCSGGVVMKGFKCNVIPRKRSTAEPLLEKYQFVSYQEEISKKIEVYEFIRLCVHIAIENIPVRKVRTIEILKEDPVEEESLISKMFVNIIAEIPTVQAEIMIYAKENHSLKEENLSGIKIGTKKLPSNKSYLLAVATNISKNTNILPEILDALKEQAFIISRESVIDDNIMENLGLDICFSRILGDQKLFLLKKKIPEDNNYSVIKITNFSYQWIPELKEKLNQIDENNQQKIILYAEKDPFNGILGLFNCLRQEPKSEFLRCFFIMDESAPDFSLENEFYKKQFKKNLSHNVYKNGKWGSYRHLVLESPKRVEAVHGAFNIAIRGDLSTLDWFEGPINSFEHKSNDKVLIHTYYLALNFRDIVVALGKLSSIDINVKSRIYQDLVMGLEFSGRDQNGKRYMGISSINGSSNIIEADPNCIWDIPDCITLEAAATIPITYATVIYSLIINGKLNKSNSVLIHAGSGGVGQAAINICTYFGCTIFTTVGSPEKVKFIKETFPQIPESHIGCSRDTSFEKLVMEKTGGRGVDLVLNSLSEDKLLASVRCLAQDGKFLEIGKYDLARNNRLELAPFLKGISFHSIVLDECIRKGGEVLSVIRKQMRKFIDEGVVKPLYRTVFENDELELAYRFMAAGKHIGKVLIKVRDEEESNLAKPIPLYMSVKPKVFFKSNKSYVITGGLGGFGLELTDWLILSGARNVTLSSRYGLKNGYQSYRIRMWKSYGANVVISTEDITTEKGVKKLLDTANALAPIGGIFNLAMVLQDDPFEKQTEETFRISAGPKAIATIHFDKLSRKMCPDLDYFVIFSSVSCGRGNLNQTNYGMSNSIMERICEARKSDNLPALAVEWGVVGEVGVVADMAEDNVNLVIGGTLPQKINSCLQNLNNFMKQTNPIVSSAVVAEKRTVGDIINAIANVLGIKDLKAISPTWTLPELGVDSMTGVEIKQLLEAEFETFFTPDDLKTMTFAKLYKMVDEKKKKTVLLATSNQNGETKSIKRLLDYEDVALPIIKMPSLENEESSEEKSSPIKPTIFFFPGIEGHSLFGKQLSVNLYAEVFSLQYLSGGVSDTFQKTAEYYAPMLMERLLPNNEYFIIGYSMGAIIAMETVRVLERRGRSGQLYIIDGSYEYSHAYFRKEFEEMENVTSLPVQVLLVISKMFPTINIDKKILTSLNTIKDSNKQKDKIKALLPENICSSTTANLIMDSWIMQLESIKNYKFGGEKLKTQVTLIRCKQDIFNIPDDYGLQKYFEHPVKIHKIDTDHRQILTEKRTAEIIMENIRI